MKSRWIWAIFSLLGASVIANVTMLWFATKDPALVIVDRYYEKGNAWDAHREAVERSAALGWDLEVVRESPFTLRLMDQEGRPISRADLACSAERIGLQKKLARRPLTAEDEGVYVLPAFPDESGIWEMKCDVRASGSEWAHTLRHDFPARDRS